jgi:aminopeptidase C
MKQKRIIMTGMFLVCLLAAAGAQEEGYEFTTVKELKITPVKAQGSSGTCWAFSGVGLIEAELIRTGKGTYDLSEMFVVNHSYRDKAEKYVRLHGYLNFAQGGSFADVLHVFKYYGALPDTLYAGLEYGEERHRHGEMERSAAATLKAIVSNPNGKLSPAWPKAFRGLIDAYLGQIPETFTWNGRTHTPETFAQSLGLNMDDYISLTSFTHQPFYSSFALEIQDNWRWALSYNLPLDEFTAVIDHAIQSGYTIAWAADVSEPGFTRDGLATLPDLKADGQQDIPEKEIILKPCKEIEVTQATRQQGYDNYQTTDDHGMLIYGIARDQTGKKFYIVKNSWGVESKYKGIWYASETFVAAKTMNIVLHKNALPKAIRSKLGL